MSLSENKELVRRFYDAVSHDGNLADLDELCASDYVHRAGSGPRDLTWLKSVVMQFRAGFPDIRYALEELIAEDDKVWARWTLKGTHLGEFQGNPASGRVVHIQDCFNIFRIVEGKIAQDRVHWGLEYMEVLRQIGGDAPK